MAIPEEKVLRGIYGDAAKEAEARFEKLQGTYEAQFGQEELTCFSAPGIGPYSPPVATIFWR